jgi:hypothetical protein
VITARSKPSLCLPILSIPTSFFDSFIP